MVFRIHLPIFVISTDVGIQGKEKGRGVNYNFHEKPKCLAGDSGSDLKISQTQLDISTWKVVIIISISKKFLRTSSGELIQTML